MKSREFKKNGRQIVVMAHNIRSIFNVGSIFRTSEGFGVMKVFLSGWTPNAVESYDPDTDAFAAILPHQRAKIEHELHKTALGAENSVPSEFRESVMELIDELHQQEFLIVGLEQNSRSILLSDFSRHFPADKFPKIALILGEEVHGLTAAIIAKCDVLVEIPMFGKKESFNVATSAGIALYEIATK